MIHFYFYSLIEGDDIICDKSPMLTEDTLLLDWCVWLDEVDGFFRQEQPVLPGKAIGSLLRLVIDVPSDIRYDIPDPENFIYLEAEILENLEYCARVRITFIDKYLHWLQTVPLPEEQTVTILPEAVLQEVRKMAADLAQGIALPASKYHSLRGNVRTLPGPSGEVFVCEFYPLLYETRGVVTIESKNGSNGSYLLKL